jgi:hypothetical protein
MRALVAGLLLLLAAQAPPIANADVIRMIAAKLGDTVIVSAIESAPRTNFDVSVDGLIALKQAGASDVVIHAMQKAATAAPRIEAPAAPPVQAPAAPAPNRPPPQAPAQAPQPRRVTPAEPPQPFVFYRVNPSTGELMTLEKAETKVPIFGLKTVSIKGIASPVAFPVDEPHAFVVSKFAGPEKIAEWQKKTFLAINIEPLAIQKEQRYATKVYLPLDITTYGDPQSGRDEKGKPWTRWNYQITPRAPLRPGQYAITDGGMFNEVDVPYSVLAFGIVAR